MIAARDVTGKVTLSPKLVLVTAILASGLAFIDASVVNVGLPAIGDAFRASSSGLQWVINAYLLPLSALLLLGGAVGDRFGRARLLVIGTALFGVASFACAVSSGMFWLIVWRALQGTGSALLMPNSLAILGASFSGEARGRAVGIWASTGAVMSATGPVLGGWLIDTVGWRAIFLINLPLAAGAIVLAILSVPDAHQKREVAKLDFLGGFLATASLGALTWGLTIGFGLERWAVSPLLLIAAGVILLLGFLAVEKSMGNRAMMPLILFASSSFVGLNLLTFLLYGALSALLILVPYVLIKTADYSATQAGAALLPFSIILASASPIMGALAGRIGARGPLTIGPIMMAAGFLLILTIGPKANYWSSMLPATLIISLGMAATVAPLTTAVLGSVDIQHTGSASGLNDAVARVGGMIATALLGGVLGTTGVKLIDGFHVAAITCAIASAAAAGCAFFLMPGNHPQSGGPAGGP